MYKSYHARRSYLPTGNSCEWLAVMYGLIKEHYVNKEKARQKTKSEKDLFRVDIESESDERFLCGSSESDSGRV